MKMSGKVIPFPKAFRGPKPSAFLHNQLNFGLFRSYAIVALDAQDRLMVFFKDDMSPADTHLLLEQAQEMIVQGTGAPIGGGPEGPA